ncbi:MAG: hypothetical protein AAGA80_26470 [Cyanobacteria bacterium P01_F01_bin.143]
MEFIANIEPYSKLALIAFGFIAALVRLRTSFSTFRRKQELKTELEIYEMMRNSDDFNIEEAKEFIENKISEVFNPKENDKLRTFFIGLVVFIGFAWWSIDIYQNQIGFSGWIILTMFLSAIGISLMLDITESEKTQKERPFYVIRLYSKSDLSLGLVFLLVGGILTPILFYKLGGLNFWMFLSGLCFTVGLIALGRNIRSERVK